MAGVGGPLVNYSGHVLGIYFCEKNQTSYLSMAAVLRILEHHRNFGLLRDHLLMFLVYILVTFLLNVVKEFYQTHQNLVQCSWIYSRNMLRNNGWENTDSWGNIAVEVALTFHLYQVIIKQQRDGCIMSKNIAANLMKECHHNR